MNWLLFLNLISSLQELDIYTQLLRSLVFLVWLQSSWSSSPLSTFATIRPYYQLDIQLPLQLKRASELKFQQIESAGRPIGLLFLIVLRASHRPRINKARR